MITKICEYCTKEFRVRPSIAKKQPCKYCSLTCKGLARRKSVIVNCQFCGAQLERKEYEVNRSKNSFCSHDCFGKYLKINYSPRNIKEIAYDIDSNGCHICTSHPCTHDGYPQIRRHNKCLRVSRYIWSQHHGEIPAGLLVRHKCDNIKCINIEHLELGTVKDNSQDMVDRGRSLTGNKNPRAKLTEARAWYIKNQNKFTTSELVKLFGVEKTTINLCKRGKSWTYLDKEKIGVP